MNKKNLKSIVALTLSAAMVAGSMMTVFADDTAQSTSQTATGTGTYEGKDGELPTLSVTLPTTFGEGVDYIADPNNLIGTVTGNGSLGSAVTVEANSGILFKSDTSKYAGTSKKLTIANENYQDIDITVKLEQKEAGDSSIIYASSDTFEAADKENKLYLALTDTKATPKKAALSSEKAAVLTTKLEGKKTNYTLKYEGGKYIYKLNDGASGWNSCDFALTGAINTNATWGEGLNFPKIQVTWSFKEHVEVPAAGSVANGKIWMSVNAETGFSERPSSITVDGTAVTDYECDAAGWVSMTPPASGKVILLVVGDTTYKVVAP